MTRVNWKAVFIYYLLACAISWPFFWWKDIHTGNWALSNVPFWLRGMGLMWGTGIAALLCFLIFRKTHRRTITFWGNSRVRSVCFFVVPVSLLALVHPPPDRLPFSAVVNPAATHLTPTLFVWAILLAFCWALGEELGWRGFLQDALRPIPFFPRFLLLGVLWAFWHFTNYTANRPLKVVAITLAISYPAFILLAFLIGIAVERSHSLWVAVAIHAWVP
jgi:membrane protease YdiL (CAAX protease family)